MFLYNIIKMEKLKEHINILNAQINNMDKNELIITKENIKKYAFYNNINQYDNFMLYQLLYRLLDLIDMRIEII